MDQHTGHGVFWVNPQARWTYLAQHAKGTQAAMGDKPKSIGELVDEAMDYLIVLVLEPDEESSSVKSAILADSRFARALQSKARGTSGSHQRVKPWDALATRVVDPQQLGARLRVLITSTGLQVHAGRAESRTLAALRDALLPQLMSGKLRVKDAENQVEGAV